MNPTCRCGLPATYALELLYDSPSARADDVCVCLAHLSLAVDEMVAEALVTNATVSVGRLHSFL